MRERCAEEYALLETKTLEFVCEGALVDAGDDGIAEGATELPARAAGNVAVADVDVQIPGPTVPLLESAEDFAVGILCDGGLAGAAAVVVERVCYSFYESRVGCIGWGWSEVETAEYALDEGMMLGG